MKPEISFPDDFTVFCDRRGPLYARYAGLRTSSTTVGHELARSALGDLAMIWPEALSSPSPSALSWRLLTIRIGQAVCLDDVDCLHRSMPLLQADAVLLRYRIGLPARDAADMMGIATAEVLAASRAALRTTSALWAPA